MWDKGSAIDAKKPFPAVLKYGIVAFAAVIVIAVALIIYFSVQKGYVATVDGEKIGVGEFNYYLSYQKDTMLKAAQAADASTTEEAFWKTNIGGKNALEVAKEKTLDSLQEIKIQLVKAKASGTKLGTTETKYIDTQIDSIVKQYGSEIKANTALKAEGLTLDDFRKMYENIILMQKYRDAEYGKLKVEAADVQTYYEKNPDWYKESSLRTNGEEAVWARHILIKVATDATDEVKATALKKAQDVLAKAKAGEDFVTLVKANSEDTGSTENGGEYLFGKSASFITEFKDAAFKLKAGEISELVKTEYGYHIIKVEEKYTEGEVASLKCAQEYNEYGATFIKAKLYKQKLDGWKKEAVYEGEEKRIRI